MDKNKRVILIVVFIIGIGICTWSIYNSIVTLTKANDNSTAEQSGKSTNSQTNGNTGSPVVIDNNDNTGNNVSDANNSDSNKDTTDKSQSGSTKTGSANTNKYMSYTVKEGESLKDICAKYADKCPAAILSKAILAANNVKSSGDIKAGMEIKIPEKYISGGIKYTVKSGDSLSSIASKYMEDVKLADAVKSIEADNFLSSDTIQVGEELFVATSVTSASNTNSSANTENEKSTSTMSVLSNRIGTLQEYTVKDGETLSSISKKYSETCPEKTAENIILKINGLTKSTDIKSGSKIKLPEQYLSQGEIYTVEAGDTLYDIVSKNMPDIDVNEGIAIVVEDNNIKQYNIVSGQKLFLASAAKQ